MRWVRSQHQTSHGSAQLQCALLRARDCASPAAHNHTTAVLQPEWGVPHCHGRAWFWLWVKGAHSGKGACHSGRRARRGRCHSGRSGRLGSRVGRTCRTARLALGRGCRGGRRTLQMSTYVATETWPLDRFGQLGGSEQETSTDAHSARSEAQAAQQPQMGTCAATKPARLSPASCGRPVGATARALKTA